MKSGAFMLYMITGILGYAHKIPLVRKILLGLSLWYGKSTWWQITVRILRIARKILVYVNAAIGVYVVFKTVGFSTDNLAAGIAMMGGEYYMILTNFVKKLFNWFVELFDYKLIPNIPDNPPSKPSLPKWNIPTNFSWTPRPVEEYAFSLRNLYKDQVPLETTAWYRDWSWSTLFWIAGSVCTIGAIYVGYQSWHEPNYLFNLITGLPSIKHTGATPPTDLDDIIIGPPGSGSSSIRSSLDQGQTNTLIDKGKSVSKGFVSLYKYTIDKLNPFNWVVLASESKLTFREFIEIQNDITRADRTLYPFTENNPFHSFFKKMRIHYFGESVDEMSRRFRYREIAESIYHEIKVGRGTEVVTTASTSGAQTLFSVPNSPILPTNTLGLNFPSPQVSPFATVLPAASPEQLNVLKTISVPTSPSLTANNLEWSNVGSSVVQKLDVLVEDKINKPLTEVSEILSSNLGSSSATTNTKFNIWIPAAEEDLD